MDTNVRPMITCRILISGALLFVSCSAEKKIEPAPEAPKFKLIETERFVFNSFVDCNMAEVWIADTFRIFPGKYGEDPVWGGHSDELEYADGKNPDEVFLRKSDEFIDPVMPANAPPGKQGLHGAVWFETVYQHPKDKTGRTLYALYHNENYPATLPYNSETGEGYIDENWPQGLRGPESPAAVCRIGIMKSTDGGKSWQNKGVLIEDLQPRLVLKPHNNSLTFAGGVGDPSAIANGEYLYVFYGEYGYPGKYTAETYDSTLEWSGQCISVARIPVSELDHPTGNAKRWDGESFNAPYNGIGKPVKTLQIPPAAGGGGASTANKMFHWGPSVSWNTYLNCWVMVMGRVEGTSWRGSSLYISFNLNQDLSTGANSQDWSEPQLLFSRPGHTLWYPSLQPLNRAEDIENRYTCLRLGKKARLFFKDMKDDKHEYLSEFIVEFDR
jgi:hypothetical protein